MLLALFVLRVLAQPLSLIIDAPLLPRFQSWQSGLLPYPALAAAQILIIAWFTRTAWRFSKGDVVPHHRRGVFFLAFGTMYFLFMLARLMLGLTVMRDSRFFTSYLPTAFHLVLASWLLVYGRFHFKEAPSR